MGGSGRRGSTVSAGIRLGRGRIDPLVRDIGVDPRLAGSGSFVSEANMLRGIVAEADAAVLHAVEVTEQDDTLGAQGLQADRVQGSQQRTPGDGA